MVPLSLLLALMAAAVLAPTAGVQIKVVAGIEKATVDPPDPREFEQRASRQPASFSGPSALAPLAGVCFSQLADRYEYEWCLFRNATRTSTGYPRVSQILGLWDTWAPPSRQNRKSPGTMMFTDGDPCLSGNRRTMQVELGCLPSAAVAEDVAFEFTNIVEEHCEHSAHLLIPIPCDLLNQGLHASGPSDADDEAAAHDVEGSTLDEELLGGSELGDQNQADNALESLVRGISELVEKIRSDDAGHRQADQIAARLESLMEGNNHGNNHGS